MFTKNQTAIAVSVVLGMSLNVAHAAPITTTGNNFTMGTSLGLLVGGTNDVTFTWDGTYNTDPASAVANATLSSPSIFFGAIWTAYNIKIYGPGNYTFSTADTLGDAGCPFEPGPFGPLACGSGADYNVLVGPNQVMGHMKFAWGPNQGIDLVNVWNYQEQFGPSPIWAGTVVDIFGQTHDAGGNPDQIWDGMSADWNGDGKNGNGMVDGPFQAFRGNFNVMGLTPIPIPGAVWLFVSGLIGLAGVVRRKKKA